MAIPEALIERARHGQATVSLWSNPGKVYQRGSSRAVADGGRRNSDLCSPLFASRRWPGSGLGHDGNRNDL